MIATIEVVRFEVPLDRAARLVADHAAATRAIHALSPASRWARLARLDDRTWLEVVAWVSRAGFERALDRSASDPVARPWFDLADPGWTLQLSGVTAAAPGPPPREGALELASGGGDGDAPPSGADWWAAAELEPRIWVDPDGWTATEPARLQVQVFAAEDPEGARSDGTAAPRRELASIVDALDFEVDEEPPG